MYVVNVSNIYNSFFFFYLHKSGWTAPTDVKSWIFLLLSCWSFLAAALFRSGGTPSQSFPVGSLESCS